MSSKVKKSKGSSAKSFKKDQRQLNLMTLPNLLFMIVFCYLPMVGLIIAFQNFKYSKGIFGSEFIGLKNFEFFFMSNDAGRVIRNTLLYNLVFIVVGTSVAVAFAVMLNFVTRKGMVKYYQTTMFIPYFLSWVVVSYMTLAFLNYQYGIFNTALKSLGMEPISWYSEPSKWPPILVFFNIWKTLGYSVMIYYATIINIDSSLYEAARIDGCSELGIVFKIIIPLIKPIIIMLTILSVGKVFRADFGLFYQLPQAEGALLSTTDVVDTYINRTLIVTGDIGISSAVGFIQSVVGFILVITTNAIVKKIDEQSAMF